MKHTRYDHTKIDKAERTPQGYLRVPATFTRVGVLKYRDAKGNIRRELRPPDEVFKPESMATLKSIPFTNDHPDVMLDSKTTKPHMVGWTGESVGPHQDDDSLLGGTLTITDEGTIRDIENGKKEVSAGYECDHDNTPGEWNGEPYDVVQRNIVYNHVSLVDRGRAGRDVRLRMDSDDAELVDDQPTTPQGDVVEKITINGKEFDVPPEVAAAFKDLSAKQAEGSEAAASMDAKVKASEETAKAAAQEKAAAEAKVGEQQSAMDKLQAKCDAQDAELKQRKDSAEPSETKMREMVKNRLRIEKVAAHVAPELKMDAMSDVEVMSAVVKARTANFDAAGKSPDYIKARFDHVTETLEQSLGALDSLGSKLVKRNDSADVPDSRKAREKMIQESKTQWQTPAAKQ